MFLDDLLIGAQCRMVPVMSSILLTAGENGGNGGNGGGNTNVSDVINGLNNGTNVQNTGEFGKKIDQVGSTGFSLIQKVGIYAAVIVFVAAGIGFLLSSGQDRDDKKKGLIMKVVGIVLIVGATGIVGALAAFSNGLFTAAGGATK